MLESPADGTRSREQIQPSRGASYGRPTLPLDVAPLELVMTAEITFRDTHQRIASPDVTVLLARILGRSACGDAGQRISALNDRYGERAADLSTPEAPLLIVNLHVSTGE